MKAKNEVIKANFVFIEPGRATQQPQNPARRIDWKTWALRLLLVVLALVALNWPVRSIKSYTGNSYECGNCSTPPLHPDYIVQPFWRWVFWIIDRNVEFEIADPFGWEP